MDELKKLTALFEKFPGIGPRQAARFVQFILRSSPSFRDELQRAVHDVARSVRQCPECMRYHAESEKRCSLCIDNGRDSSLLAIVAGDIDLDALEKSGTYKGKYFVIGGTISLSTEKAKKLRLRELLSSLHERISRGLKEVIIALPANPEGDFTAVHVREALLPYAREHEFQITNLGRGLSTGSELEYADPDTIRAALESRK